MKSANILVFFCILIFFTISAGCSYQAQSTPVQAASTGQAPIPFPSPGKSNITSPGIYYLTRDIAPEHISRVSPGTFESSNGMTASHFIVIRSSNVILDGMGHTIYGNRLGSDSGYTYGIYVDRPLHGTRAYSVVIRNITVKNWSTGIFVHNVDNFTLEDSSVIQSDAAGASFFSSSDISILHTVFSGNGGCGITGSDVGELFVSESTITGNQADGIKLSGAMEVPVRLELPQRLQIFKKNYLDLYLFHTYQKTTSGSGFLITRNEIAGNLNGISLSNTTDGEVSYNDIRNSRNSGVNVRNVDNLTISDNTIAGSEHYGILYQTPVLNLVEVNNTFSDNKENTKKSENNLLSVSVSIVLGTFLIGMLKVLGGTSNIVSRAGIPRLIAWGSAKCSGVGKSIAAVTRNRLFSKLFETPAGVTIIGAAIFGGAYAYATSVQLAITTFCGILIMSGIVTVTPRAVQYLFTQKNGLEADYRMWWWGIFVIITTMIITMLLQVGAIFGQPVKMEIQNETLQERRKILWTKFLGPITVITLSGIFFFVYSMKGPAASFAIIGMKMSLLSAVVLLLPVSPMEGEYIGNWNKWIWAVLFSPTLIAYFIVLLLF